MFFNSHSVNHCIFLIGSCNEMYTLARTRAMYVDNPPREMTQEPDSGGIGTITKSGYADTATIPPWYATTQCSSRQIERSVANFSPSLSRSFTSCSSSADLFCKHFLTEILVLCIALYENTTYCFSDFHIVINEPKARLINHSHSRALVDYSLWNAIVS